LPFLLPSPTLYLDNNATTRPPREVVEAVALAMRDHWANPSSIHRAGQDARHAIELARASIAGLLGAKPKSITFCSGGTEAINAAIRGVLSTPSTHSPPQPTPPKVVSTQIEHAAVRDLLDDLEKKGAITRATLTVDRAGLVTPESLQQAITPGTRLVSVQWANNETGAIQPVAAIAARSRTAGAVFHCDATQYVGKMPVDLGADPPPCDILTCSAHKWHGPKGVGILWTRPGFRLPPLIHGTQEQGRRGGTENAEGIIGAGVAAELTAAWLADPSAREKTAALRDRFEHRVLTDNQGAAVNGPTDPTLRLWNTTNIAFPRLEAEALLMAFSERGLCASAGAACSSGSLDPSPVLLAMGVLPELAHGSIRFSLSRCTTEQEVDQAGAIVTQAATKVRSSMTG
jgi:cysteine desulfurase